MGDSTLQQKLSRVDLNLLVALNALLEERSVTGAATRLGLTQPALSASLARLRVVLSDELMVRRGNRYEFTALAERLAEQVPFALETVGRIFDQGAVFDAGRSRREFVLIGSDYSLVTLGTAASALAAEEAPRVSFRFRPISGQNSGDAEDVLRTADGMILPRGSLHDVPRLDVLEDTWVCVVSAGNSRVGDALTLDLLARLPWAVAHQTRTTSSPPIRQLRALGVEPRFDAIVEEFLALPHFVLGTDRVAFMQRRLVPLFAAMPGLRFLPCPFPVDELVDSLWWHPMRDRDPGHRWMRELLVRAGSAPAR